MKIKKLLAAVLLVLFCFGMTGCYSLGQTDVEELLRAPQFSGQYNQVQKALNTYLGEPAQLKYPTGGNSQSPFLFGDWDGNGTDDAAVMYISSAKGQNVQLAILEQYETGWLVTQEIEGLSSEVAGVSVAAIAQGEEKGSQLIVGYGTPQGDKYLAVYGYKDVTLFTVWEASYSEYLITDLTGSGSQDLVIVQNEDDAVQLQILTSREGRYRVAQTLSVAQGKLTGCAGIYASEGGRQHHLILDGYVGSGGSLASEILYYSTSEGQLLPYDFGFQENISEASLRNFLVLHSMDVDKDGRVEIPSQLTGEEGGSISAALDRRLSFVKWWDYTASNRFSGMKSYGVTDSEYGFYLALPDHWQGKVMLTVGNGKNSWEVHSLEDDELYLTVRIADLGTKGQEGFQRAGLLGQQQILVKATDAAKTRGFMVTGSVTVL